MPPTYCFTGNQRFTASLLKGFSVLWGSAKRRKYQEEHMKVSMVSVSRLAGLPQQGQATFTQSLCWLRGEPPFPERSMPRGSSTGRSSRGTGTAPQSSQWMTGMGQPQ